MQGYQRERERESSEQTRREIEMRVRENPAAPDARHAPARAAARGRSSKAAKE